MHVRRGAAPLFVLRKAGRPGLIGNGESSITRRRAWAITTTRQPDMLPQVQRLEFTSRAFIAWTQQHGIQYLLIEPGKPMQNGYIESFNGKFPTNASTNTGSRVCSKRVT